MRINEFVNSFFDNNNSRTRLHTWNGFCKTAGSKIGPPSAPYSTSARVHRMVIITLEAALGSCRLEVWDHRDAQMQSFLCDADLPDLSRFSTVLTV